MMDISPAFARPRARPRVLASPAASSIDASPPRARPLAPTMRRRALALASRWTASTLERRVTHRALASSAPASRASTTTTHRPAVPRPASSASPPRRARVNASELPRAREDDRASIEPSSDASDDAIERERAARRRAFHRARGVDVDEFGGPAGLEPTRYGDWERGGRASDF